MLLPTLLVHAGLLAIAALLLLSERRKGSIDLDIALYVMWALVWGVSFAALQAPAVALAPLTSLAGYAALSRALRGSRPHGAVPADQRPRYRIVWDEDLEGVLAWREPGEFRVLTRRHGSRSQMLYRGFASAHAAEAFARDLTARSCVAAGRQTSAPERFQRWRRAGIIAHVPETGYQTGRAAEVLALFPPRIAA